MNLPPEINAATEKILYKVMHFVNETDRVEAMLSIQEAERSCEIAKARATIRALMISRKAQVRR